MNELENSKNEDDLLSLLEDLQTENEDYRHQISRLENQKQTHLSDKQNLKSQIQSMQSTIAEQGQEIQNLNAHIAKLAESDLVLIENTKLKKEIQQVRKENEKAQKLFEEAMKKEENANATLNKAKALEADFSKHLSSEAKYICKQAKANMQTQLQEKLRIQAATLSIWTWIIAFISVVQTGYILYVNEDIVGTIPGWFLNRGKDLVNVVNGICKVY